MTKWGLGAVLMAFISVQAEAKYFDFLHQKNSENLIRPMWDENDKECPKESELNRYIRVPAFHDLNKIAKVKNIPGLNTHDELQKEFTDREMIIYYELAKKFDSKKKTIIFIPGGPGQDHSFIHGLGPLINQYTSLFQDYNVMAMDHRGVGCSRNLFPGREPFQSLLMRQAASDIDLIRKELNLDKIIVWGGSYGTMLGQTYALLYPDKVERLILWEGFSSWKDFAKAQSKYESFVVSSVPVLKEQYAEFKKTYPEWALRFMRWTAEPWYSYTGRVILVPDTFIKLKAALENGNYDRADELLPKDKWIQGWMTRSIACTEIFNWKATYQDEIQLFPQFESCKEFEGQEEYFDYTESLRNIEAPTYIYAGHYDHVTPVEAMLKMHNRIPQSYMYLDPHTGHGVDKPECFSKMTYGFIEGLNDDDLDSISLTPACKQAPVPEITKDQKH